MTLAGLFNKYPKNIVVTEYHFEPPPGWLDLLDRAIGQAVACDPGLKVLAAKQKFGGLRLTWILGDSPNRDAANEILRAAERASFAICETCGDPGQIRKAASGWLYTSCGEHKRD